MDMHPSNDLIHALMNSHSWYHIDTPLDYVRALLWCSANLATAFAYFFIPTEIWRWRRVLPFAASSLIGTLFVAFITLCGLSHLAMLFIMQTAPWWATLLVYTPMAIVSVATIAVIRRERSMIVAVLGGVAKALRQETS